MASSRPPSSPSSPSPRKSWARSVERCCCSTLSHLPLVFVYGLTTWAIFVEVKISFLDENSWIACLKAVLGVLLYGIANVSYTTAVFTNPGSPLDLREDLSISRRGGSRQSATRSKGAYDALPTYENDDPSTHASSTSAPPDMTTVTAKSSTGRSRYCKKCQTLKPDRTHHCSTCGRCVLKMDHHCPWLATCVGLRNYKPFLLFLIYICLFCWLCFGVTALWVWAALTDDMRLHQSYLLVNTVMLAVLSGIIGLVLSLFTAWHIYLVIRNETTIESLEKTRYLSPLRKSMAPAQHLNTAERHSLADVESGDSDVPREQEMGLLEQLKETHANALPGILRPEEGESSHPGAHTPTMPSAAHNGNNTNANGTSPAHNSLQNNYASLEAQREQDRYNAYLDEQDSEKLPNAFDMGWRRNALHVFGRQPLLWFLPVCNTSGDGWMWEVSPKWTEARASQARERDARMREDAARREIDSQSLQAGGGSGAGRFEGPPPRRDWKWTPGQGFIDRAAYPPTNHGGIAGEPSHVQMQSLDRRKGPLAPPVTSGAGAGDGYDASGDEDFSRHSRLQNGMVASGTANWNDLPDDFLPARMNGYRDNSHGRRKGD